MSSSSSVEQPRFSAIEVENFSGLEGRVRLELDATCTVLVGKNGAGKSLLVESIARGARNALVIEEPVQSNSFRCEVIRASGAPLAYEYTQELVDSTSGDPSGRERWSERCWELEGEELWAINGAELRLRGGAIQPWRPSMSLLCVNEKSFPEVGQEVSLLRRMLSGVRPMMSGLPRVSRQEILIPVMSREAGLSTPTPPQSRFAEVARWIISRRDAEPETYKELVEILYSLGVTKQIDVETYLAQRDPSAAQMGFSALLFDGVNLGLQSDGTLRVVEMVVQLLQRGATCLLIEEPELAVHPGLLGRLLALMESYALDRQIVLTTHAPQVVNWCAPSQLRIAERAGNTTIVRGIDASQMSRITRYLNDQGTLADFLYGHSSES